MTASLNNEINTNKQESIVNIYFHFSYICISMFQIRLLKVKRVDRVSDGADTETENTLSWK
jgi:hypothetical protein